MLCVTRVRERNTFNRPRHVVSRRHARHAVAGNPLMLKLATSRSHTTTHNSHTFATQPAAVGMSPQRLPHSVAATGESGRWPGPLPTLGGWTPVGATPRTGGLRRADIQPATPSCEGRSRVSEPVSSQPGSSLP